MKIVPYVFLCTTLLYSNISFGVVTNTYKKLNNSFTQTVEFPSKFNSEILYGHPKIGYFKPKTATLVNGKHKVTYLPPTYKYKTQFFEKNKQGKFVEIFRKKNKSPLPPAFRLIRTKVTGKFSQPFYLMGGSLPRSRFKNPKNSALQADFPMKNKSRFSFSMIVNRLGEIVFVNVPFASSPTTLSNSSSSFNSTKEFSSNSSKSPSENSANKAFSKNLIPYSGYPVVEPLGDGKFGILFGKKDSVFSVFNWKGERIQHIDMKNASNPRPFHHDFIAYNGRSFVSMGYSSHNYGSEKSYLTTTIMKTYIKKNKTKIIKDFADEFNPFNISWKEEKKRKHFLSWDQDDVDYDFTHGNGLRTTKWGHIVSFRHLSRIALLHKKDLNILWTVGPDKDNDFVAMGKARFDFQHSPTIDKNKNLILFDNGFANKKSRILALRLRGKKARFVWEFPKNSPYYSKDRGSVVISKNDNLLAYFVSPKVNGKAYPKMTRSDFMIEFDPENQKELGKMKITFFTKSPGYRAMPLDSISRDPLTNLN